MPEALRDELSGLEQDALRALYARRPVQAAQLGLRLPGQGTPLVTAEQVLAAADECTGVQARALALADLLPADDDEGRLTCDLVAETCGHEASFLSGRWQRFTVSPLPEIGLSSELLTFLPYAAVGDEEGAERLVALCRDIPRALADSSTELALGRAEGLLPVSRLVQRSIEQIEAYLASPPEQDRYVQAGAASGRSGVASELQSVVAEQVRPAFQTYATVLRDEVLPTARDDDRAGLAALPGGRELYAATVRNQTTCDLGAAQAHAEGLALVAGLRAEVEAAARELGWAPDFATARDRLRHDPALRFDDAAQMVSAARDAMARAAAIVPEWIGPLPQAPCEVTEMDPVESPHGVLGHYETAPLDRSRPATYWLNVAHPREQPRFEMEALTFHESVPGHHLQVATAQEQLALSPLRRLVEVMPYVEGWALAMERFADERGLYSGPLPRLGMLSFALWRACRMVVDTGLHDLGWSRDRAVAYLLENTILTSRNIDNEVDRYLGYPGSALAYQVGATRLQRLRERCVQDPADPAESRAFFGAVLGAGPLTMTLLERAVPARLGVTTT